MQVGEAHDFGLSGTLELVAAVAVRAVFAG
jgi:hypothetical protein